jgi:hypothetical protein
MSRTITLPDEIMKQAEELAAFERVSVEEFVSAKLAEQFAGLGYLKRRAERASMDKFRAALLQIPDVEPEEADRF